MEFEDPKIAASQRPQDPNAHWNAPKPAVPEGTASGRAFNEYSSAAMRDGAVVSTEIGKRVASTTTDANALETNAAQNTPWMRAVDPIYKNSQLPSDVSDDSILTFANGSECTLRQARALGWVKDASAVAAPQVETPEEQHDPETAVEPLANRAMDEQLDALIQNTGGMEQVRAISEIVATGSISEATLGTLATQLQMEPAQLQAQLAPVMAEFEKQARSVMSEGGLDSNAVLSWAWQTCPDKLQAAMDRQGSQRNTRGYADLRHEYLASMADHSPQGALNADLGPGVSQHMMGRKVIVTLPGGATMEWRSAINSFGRK